MDHLLDIEAIRALLPQRYPMLLIDRVLELQPGHRVVALKNVTINEPFFDGHFPGMAVMPGVLILESMAQAAGLIVHNLPEHRNKITLMGGVDRCRFMKPVVPGDTMIIEASLKEFRGSVGKTRMAARVEGTVVARCEMLFKLIDPPVSTLESVLEKLMSEEIKVV